MPLSPRIPKSRSVRKWCRLFTDKKICDNSNYFWAYGEASPYTQYTTCSCYVMRCVFEYWHRHMFSFTFFCTCCIPTNTNLNCAFTLFNYVYVSKLCALLWRRRGEGGWARNASEADRHLCYFRLIYCLLVLRFKQSLFKCVHKQPNLQNILALHALCLSAPTARIQIGMLATDSFFSKTAHPEKWPPP
jgi:hypothetical protein